MDILVDYFYIQLRSLEYNVPVRTTCSRDAGGLRDITYPVLDFAN